jgi:hypothetical protein
VHESEDGHDMKTGTMMMTRMEKDNDGENCNYYREDSDNDDREDNSYDDDNENGDDNKWIVIRNMILRLNFVPGDIFPL